MISLKTFSRDFKVTKLLILASLLVFISKLVSLTNMDFIQIKRILLISVCLHFLFNFGYYFLSENLWFFSLYFLFLKIFQFVDSLISLLLFKYLFSRKHILYYFVFYDFSIFMNSVFGSFIIQILNENLGENISVVNMFFNIMSFILFYLY